MKSRARRNAGKKLVWYSWKKRKFRKPRRRMQPYEPEGKGKVHPKYEP